ncbi:Uncharacterised protein [Mycobacteroides abscessus subsp. abscessus]|nr:Uncharacterised protein [Mycobacteroides abscessus subsp. abscessus]
MAAVLHNAHDGVDEPGAGILGSREDGFQHFTEPEKLAVEQCLDDRGLITHVLIDGGSRQARLLGDQRVQTGLIAVLQQAFLSGIEDTTANLTVVAGASAMARPAHFHRCSLSFATTITWHFASHLTPSTCNVYV